MITILAFVAGISVTVLAIFLPHARSEKSSMENFESFRDTLASLPMVRDEKPQNV